MLGGGASQGIELGFPTQRDRRRRRQGIQSFVVGGKEFNRSAAMERRAHLAAEAKAARDKSLADEGPPYSAAQAAECRATPLEEERRAPLLAPAKAATFAISGTPVTITPQEQERRARSMPEAKARWEKKAMIWAAEAKALQEKRLAGEDPEDDEGDRYFAAQAAKFRETWNWMYSGPYGSFQDTTKIPNKRFTYKKPGPNQTAGLFTTLQIISLKVARIRGGLQWPLHVFGMVAVRDPADHNRNIIFHRPRHNCQILTQEVPYLKLVGPVRAVLAVDPLTFEVDLKVKGATESEDKCLSFLAVTYINFVRLDSHLLTRDYASKLSTLEFELGSIVSSVEATVAVRVTSGSWPDGLRVQFAASTASIRDAEIILLDCGADDKVPVAGYYGSIKLSRSVVSVDDDGQLRLSVKAWQGDEIYAHRKKAFKAKEAGTSAGTLDFGFCAMDVSIAWSVISLY